MSDVQIQKKQITINIIANIISYGIGVIISFYFTPYIINTIGADAYGFYPLANNFVSYAQLLVIALNSMAARFITIKMVENDTNGMNRYFSSVFFSNVILAGILIVPLSIIALRVDKFLNVPPDLVKDVTMLFIFTFGTLLMSILTSVFEVSTFCKNRIDIRSYKDMVYNVLRVLLFISFFSLFPPSITYIGIISFILGFLSFIFSIWITKKIMPEAKVSLKLFDKVAVRELLSSGIWNSFNQLSVILLSGLDLLIANIFLGATLSGAYSIAQTMPTFIKTFTGILIGAFIPTITYKYAQNDKQGLLMEVKKSNRITAVIMGVIVAGFVGLGDIFYSLWVPTQDSSMLQMLSFLIMVPTIFSMGINTLYSVNTVYNKVKIPSIVLFVSAIINVIMVIILLKTTNLGVFAIPLSSAILNIARIVFFTPIYTCSIMGIKWYTFYIDVIKSSLGIISTIIICIIIKSIFKIDSWMQLVLTAIICGTIGLIINSIFVLNKSDLRNILEIIKSKLKRKWC